jgi:HD superfamily phosphohydrolase YqeK
MKQLEEVKVEIIDLLKEVDREGMDSLIMYLLENDYFTAPASSKYHFNEVGGLARHSLLVYNLLKQKNELFKIGVDEDTIILCGLLHDLCKMNFYKKTVDESITPSQLKYLISLKKLDEEHNAEEIAGLGKLTKVYTSKLIDYIKNGSQGEAPKTDEIKWDIEDQLPLGHGEKSIAIIQRFINLTDEELLAIRWHMSFSDPSTIFKWPVGFCYDKAIEKYPLVVTMFTADFEARMYADIVKKKQAEIK